MSERLRDYLRHHWLSAEQYEAGAAWYGDWLLAGRELTHATMQDGPAARCAGGADVMRQAALQRLRRAESALGGRDAPWYKLARQVVLLERPVKEVAVTLEVEPRAAMDVLRLTLGVLVRVYRLRELA